MARRQKTPRGMRTHIAVFGRRNVGKSSLLNALTGQQVSIVSDYAGTTTDPVFKTMELQPIGPVVFIDTAGVDDEGELGALRIQKTRRQLSRTDVAVLVATAGSFGDAEQELLDDFRARKIPHVVAFNKTDQLPLAEDLVAQLELRGARVVATSATSAVGIDALRAALVACSGALEEKPQPILGDLIPEGGLVVLVIPVDKEAPKGRLILPQAQAIRDLLDHHATALVTRESTLAATLNRLKTPPDLVVTDSQAFGEVSQIVPPEVPLTGFSILFSRLKGDLGEQVRGAAAIDRLGDGSRVLIAEACTHHPIGEDIGREKLPAWLAAYTGSELQIDVVSGRDFPEDGLSGYDLVIHCGACVFNKRELRHRISTCAGSDVPITNYGLAIAHTQGILERALEPFAEARAALATDIHDGECRHVG